MSKMLAGYGLTLVAQAMNVGYEWSLNDSVSSTQLETLKRMALGSIPLIIIGLLLLRNARRVGKVQRSRQDH